MKTSIMKMMRGVYFLFTVITISFAVNAEIFAYSLKDGVHDALKQSRIVKAARFKEEAIEINESVARAGFLPKLSVRLAEEAKTVRSYEQTHSQGMVNGGLVMSQNIYDGFATTNGVRSAKVKTEIERLVSQEIVNDTIKTAIIAYQDIILSRNRMQLREKQSDLMAATLKEVKVKHSKAIINSTDLAEAYAQESAIEAQYVAAESMLRKSEAQFMRIFNKVPPTALEEISEKLMNDSLPKSIEDCYDLMDKKNKQIEIHRLKLKDYNIMYRSAGSALLPSVNIEYKVEKMLQVSKFEEDYDVEGSVTGASLGVAVNIPLFHADKLAKRKALGKEILASEEEFGDKYSKMRERVLSAWHDYISVKKMMIYHVKNARAKEEAVNAMKIESEIGTKTMTDLMRARTDLFESQIKIMEGQKSLINSSVSLLDLIGGLDISIFAN